MFESNTSNINSNIYGECINYLCSILDVKYKEWIHIYDEMEEIKEICEIYDNLIKIYQNSLEHEELKHIIKRFKYVKRNYKFCIKK